jgi:hypothetical protein
MAWELPLFKPGGLKAAASLATKQFYCVKVTADNSVNLCTADGEFVFGILQNKPGSGDAAEVWPVGISKAQVGTTVAAGDKFTVDSSGSIRPISLSDSGADIAKYVAGIVIEGAATGGLATVLIGVNTAIVNYAP